MEADSESAVNARLRQQQLNPVKVKAKPKALKGDSGAFPIDTDIN